MYILKQADLIVKAAYRAIPTAKYDLVTVTGQVIPNVIAFGLQADRVRATGEGNMIQLADGLGTCIEGKIQNLRQGTPSP